MLVEKRVKRFGKTFFSQQQHNSRKVACELAHLRKLGNEN